MKDLGYDYIPGTILIRTCDEHKNLYITVFLLTIFGPDYHVTDLSYDYYRRREKKGEDNV